MEQKDKNCILPISASGICGDAADLKASTVVEMAVLMPVVLMVWVLAIFGLFYYHDKGILTGAAYETAVAASQRKHDMQGEEAGRAEQYFEERISGEMLYFSGAQVEVSYSFQKVRVSATAESGRFRIHAVQTASTIEPENTIRRVRAIKNVFDRMTGETGGT